MTCQQGWRGLKRPECHIQSVVALLGGAKEAIMSGAFLGLLPSTFNGIEVG